MAVGVVDLAGQVEVEELQARNLSFSDITVLKQGEAQHGYRTLLWPNSKGSEISLLPNLTVKDPVWRELLRDTRFRHALSLGIDRDTSPGAEPEDLMALDDTARRHARALVERTAGTVST